MKSIVTALAFIFSLYSASAQISLKDLVKKKPALFTEEEAGKGIREALWVLKDKKLAVWGMSFKPNTDDVRCSVAINLIEAFVEEGADVTAYDPKAMDKARQLPMASKIKFAESALEAARG